ncbi:MAG: Holliday junction resolvase RuvX [Planctomycetales bacterium]
MAASSEKPDGVPFPLQGTLLGIDYGVKRLGFAVCNSDQTIASPVENYTRSSKVADAQALKRVVADYRVVGLIVGLPVHMSGAEGGTAFVARTFGTWAAEVTGLPLRFADERFTSQVAEGRLFAANLSDKKRKARLDMLAAQAILQGYLDGPRTDAPPESIR